MPDTPHIWILNYWGGTRTLYLSITHSNSSTSPFLKQQMAPYANPNYANGCFARFQKVFCVVPQCIVTFLWNQIKFQKQVMPCWHLKPDIMSTSWEWMAYPAFPAPMHFYVLFLQTCQNEFGLSWPIIFWWPVFCSRNLRWLRDLFTNFEQFLARTSIHIPSTSVQACDFQSLRPPFPWL